MNTATTSRPVGDRAVRRAPAPRTPRRAVTRFVRRLPARLLVLVLLIIVVYPLVWLLMLPLRALPKSGTAPRSSTTENRPAWIILASAVI